MNEGAPGDAWLENLARTVDAGDAEQALDDALVAWRRHRVAALADLVDALSDLTDGASRAPLAAPAVRFHTTWLTALPGASAARLPALLGTLTKHVPKGAYDWPGLERRFAPFRARVEALAARPADPRIATALAKALVEMPKDLVETWGTDAALSSTYRSTLKLLVDLADARVAALLRATTAAMPPTLGYRPGRAAWLGRRIDEVCGPIEQLAANAALPPEIERDVRALEARARARCAAGRRPANELLAAVYADPDDDDARHVFGDALLEIGDPRGEVMSLSLRAAAAEADVARATPLSAPMKNRMNALIRDLEPTWIGEELMRVLCERVYRRGMLEEATLVRREGVADVIWEAAREQPALATLRVLRQGTALTDDYLSFLSTSALRGLRVLTAETNELLERIASAHVVLGGVTELVLALSATARTFDHVDACAEAMPGVRRITFGVFPEIGIERAINGLLASRTATRLHEIVLASAGGDDPTPFLRVLDERRPVARAELRSAHAAITVVWSEPDASAATSADEQTAPHVTCETQNGWDLEPLAGLARVSHLTLRPRGGVERRLGNAKELADLLARLAPVSVDAPAKWAKQLGLEGLREEDPL